MGCTQHWCNYSQRRNNMHNHVALKWQCQISMIHFTSKMHFYNDLWKVAKPPICSSSSFSYSVELAYTKLAQVLFLIFTWNDSFSLHAWSLTKRIFVASCAQPYISRICLILYFLLVHWTFHRMVVLQHAEEEVSGACANTDLKQEKQSVKNMLNC